MSKIGYIRVSTEHQETARQQEIMCDYQADRIFSEKISVSTQNASQFSKDRTQHHLCLRSENNQPMKTAPFQKCSERVLFFCYESIGYSLTVGCVIVHYVLRSFSQI